ncbi:diaminopimelate decarboxylase [Acidaminobacter sp. JC074]|uniref:diaminopimelate decarboxylase n=1 Tax=Acidaminobacter sp. JC074 TaxID=2530199 RepID=UPI001F0FB40A|nr:diaminopimelate decarboxylase [Acidaminobacter sp. JC074]
MNMIFDGCDTTLLAKKYGTPLYIISQSTINERIESIQQNFLKKYPNTKAVYASKAFLPMAMCKIIQRGGLGLDVVSGGELYIALKSGFDPKMIEFNGNNKNYKELELAIKNDVGRIIVDNLLEIKWIEELSNKYNKKTYILFRIVPDIETDTHDYISTGHKSSKFGITLENNFFFNTFEQVMKSNNINIKGIHFHIGSQLHDNKSHLNATRKTLHLIKDIKMKYGYDIEELNIGGGFGIKYTDEDPVKPIEYFIDPIMNLIDSFCLDHRLERPMIITEPGRWIIGEAGMTLYTIGSIKENGQTKYAAIDGGMTDNIRPSLYQAKYAACLANKIDQSPDEIITLSGKFCESSDILIKDIKLPKIATGDLLAVYATGAYTYSMASNYNGQPIPPVVLVNKGQDHLIVKGQTYDDLIINNLIPKYLEV